MPNIQPTLQPEAGSYFNMMSNIDGTISIAANASVTAATSQLSPGVTVVKGATGLYVVTFPKPYSFCPPYVTFQAAAAVALYPQIAALTNQSFTIRLVNGSGAATDPSAVCAIHFLVRARESSLTR